MWCSRARLETCSSIPNGPAMMRPSSARGSEAASVEDAALPTREQRMSCLKVVSLDTQQPFCQEGSEMKKQRESQCTQKTISLLSPLGTIQVSGCENGVHTIQILMDVAPAEREAGSLSPQLLIQIQSQIVSVNYLSVVLLHSGFSCEKLSVLNRSSPLCGTSSSPGFEY
ncbi:hypothetical protein GBF38_002372 [Nibea albiflora]|uniref:Uncharacterized protein n=1 Tax=Nibea albiflora TaxID=240163 RepID=A0ACB7EE76_NIBAL|nr:hypothetical protein GBF38_002372 [Nibea albiflora]